MFIGHYGPAFAGKAALRSIPLWVLFIAVQWMDVCWSVLVLLGVEKLRIVPGFLQGSPLDLYYMPYTHGLLGALALSAILGGIVATFYRERRGAVFAVIATNLFAEQHPQWFGTIGHSMYTLFQIMTLESWSMGIVRPLMETHPYAWAFFIPFILIATFTMLNLFIAIIVNAMQTQAEQESKKTINKMESATHELDQHIQTGIHRIEEELASLRQLITQHQSDKDRANSGNPQ